MVSTHSRPKAAGKPRQWSAFQVLFQHTAARRRLVAIQAMGGVIYHLFQHTAARRRLDGNDTSRECRRCFNTQPPEGGWVRQCTTAFQPLLFQHTAARRRLVIAAIISTQHISVSTHSRPKAAGSV